MLNAVKKKTYREISLFTIIKNKIIEFCLA